MARYLRRFGRNVSEREYNRSDLDDLAAACTLLGGYTIGDEHGLPKKRYLDDDSGEAENDARKAIVRLLLNGKPLDVHLRRLLAALFDPETPPYTTPDGAPVERKIVFEHKAPRNRETLRELAIAHAVWEARSRYGKVESAISDVTKRFRISRRSVLMAWRRYKEILEPPVQS